MSRNKRLIELDQKQGTRIRGWSGGDSHGKNQERTGVCQSARRKRNVRGEMSAPDRVSIEPLDL
jgi:hypothetical protein